MQTSTLSVLAILAGLALAVAAGTLLGGEDQRLASTNDATPDAGSNGSDEAPPVDEDAFQSLVCPKLSPLQQCNVRATNGAQVSEVDVAVDPEDPDHWVAVGKVWSETRLVPDPEEPTQAGQVLIAHAVSFDGGLSWSWDHLEEVETLADSPVTDHAVRHGDTDHSDPTVAFTSEGNVLATTLGLPTDAGPTEVRAYLSTDGGRTFEHIANAFNGTNGSQVRTADKPWLEVDQERERAYVAFAVNGQDENTSGVFIASSTDEGRNWTAPSRVCDCETPQIAIAPNGSLYMVGLDSVAPDHADVLFTRSHDRGENWTTPVEVATNIGVHQYKGANGRTFRATNVPYIAVEQRPTDDPPQVYIVWGDHPQDLSSPPTTYDGLVQVPNWNVYLAKSPDGGRSWSNRTQINDGPLTDGTAALQPMVEAGPNGALHVAWLDQRRNPTGISIEIRYDFAWNGTGFGEDLLVTDVPSVPLEKWHDYLGLEATGDQAYLAWPDSRFGTSEILTARVQR